MSRKQRQVWWAMLDDMQKSNLRNGVQFSPGSVELPPCFDPLWTLGHSRLQQ